MSAVRLAGYYEQMREHKGWRHLFDSEGEAFTSFEGFCLEQQPFGLGYDRQAIEGIIAERKSVQQIAVEAKPQRTKAEAKLGNTHAAKQEKENTGYNVTCVSDDPAKESDKPKRGNDPEYLASRIARDKPEILEKMQNGEYPSVRAAAVDAGIVKVATSLEKVQKAYLKLSESEKRAFWKWAEEERNTMD